MSENVDKVEYLRTDIAALTTYKERNVEGPRNQLEKDFRTVSGYRVKKEEQSMKISVPG